MDGYHISTNDVFSTFILVLRLHKDKELQIKLFEMGGYPNVSRTQISKWQVRSGEYKRGFRAMPEPALRAFMNGLIQAKLIEDPDEE